MRRLSTLRLSTLRLPSLALAASALPSLAHAAHAALAVVSLAAFAAPSPVASGASSSVALGASTPAGARAAPQSRVASQSRAAGAASRSSARRSRAANSRGRGVRVKPADIFDAMYFKERAESDIGAAALAAYGNSLVARRGLDFWFDACDVVRANPRPQPARDVAASAVAYAYTLRRVGGGAINLRFISDESKPSGGACAECFFQLPSVRVTRREVTVVAGGRRYRLQRPRGFLLHEASLWDESRQRVLRSWQLPFQNIPLGLSADRTRLYVPLPNFDDEQWDDKLALELSDAGVRFVPRERLNLPEHEWLTGAPERDDTSFIRYGRGARSYVLRFTDPCT